MTWFLKNNHYFKFRFILAVWFEMVEIVKTFANIGLIWHEIYIEADSVKALPNIEIIGLPDLTVKEAKERIRWTFRNSSIEMPKRKFVLNLAPSDTKKVWTWFDVPMALALLLRIRSWQTYNIQQIQNSLFFGELWLDGSIKRINWLLPSVLSAKKKGWTQFFIPAENLYELEYVPWIKIYPLQHFQQLFKYFCEWVELDFIIWGKDISTLHGHQDCEVDFAHIKGQLVAKRALSIAMAWFHNVLMIWAPWSWKTMMSKAMKSIFPPLTFDEILQVSQIYSVVWKLNKDLPLITQRPFRQVHHTASRFSIIWWGTHLTPWEVSLAHKWILFFDELTEFPRETLEVLRQPLEDRFVNISRVAWTVEYPANFMFIASMNPCKCWYYKDKHKVCTCSPADIKRYQSKISGPLLDRIDVILEIPRENIDTILDIQNWENSETIRQKVIHAREIQQERFKWTNLSANAHMWAKDIQNLIPLSSECKDFLSNAADKLNLSWRVVHRTIKLARTIADMQNKSDISVQNLAEAIQYRSRTMFIDE